MKKLILLLSLSFTAYADRDVWFPDGTICSTDDNGYVTYCFNQPKRKIYQPKKPLYYDRGSRYGKTGTLDKPIRYEYNFNLYDEDER